jgi:hypothetical protein
MNIVFGSSSPRGGESCANRIVTQLVGELQNGHPNVYANEIIEARRALVAELELRRRVGALAA